MEWNKVIVSVTPLKRDKIELIEFYKAPHILGETEIAEFTRIYYIACSRAKEELYIHLPNDKELISTIKKCLKDYNENIRYEFVGE